MDVNGKVAIITGSARGIGKAYAEALLSRGANVVIADVLIDLGKETAAEFKSKYGGVMFVECDVTVKSKVKEMYSKVIAEFGSIDIVINNAGIGAYRDCKLTFDINVFGVINSTQLAEMHMRNDKGGRGGVIVNISSMAGLYTFNSCEMYQATKHAVSGYSGGVGKRLAVEKVGVRLVALCPGYVKTDLTKDQQDKEVNQDAKMLATLEKHGGWTPMSDVVNACMYVIENDIDGGSMVQIDAMGLKLAHTNEFKLTDFE